MFTVDSLPASYYEEREAAETARRQALAQQNKTNTSTSQNLSPPSQRTTMSRPPSSSVIGNLFSGLARAATPAQTWSTPSSGTSTPVQTPPAKVITQAEVEKLMEEKKRDADIMSFRAW